MHGMHMQLGYYDHAPFGPRRIYPNRTLARSVVCGGVVLSKLGGSYIHGT